MTTPRLFGHIWDEEEVDLKDVYLTYFQELKDIVETAADNGQGLLVSIG